MYRIEQVSSEDKLCAKWKILNNDLVQKEKTLFLDRDGVIILDHGYVNTISRTDFIEETLNIMWVANQNGIPITIITNQAGVAHGLFSEKDLIAYNLDLLNLIYQVTKVKVNSFYYCPSHPVGALGAYRKSCNCRKPMTGLFEEASRDSKAVISESLFIGDKESDAEAAKKLSIPYLMYNNIDLKEAVVGWIANERESFEL
jgi:D-glycero-D-manno-heptose 1,7-bisphosphate phosphatase